MKQRKHTYHTHNNANKTNNAQCRTHIHVFSPTNINQHNDKDNSEPANKDTHITQIEQEETRTHGKHNAWTGDKCRTQRKGNTQQQQHHTSHEHTQTWTQRSRTHNKEQQRQHTTHTQRREPHNYTRVKPKEMLHTETEDTYLNSKERASTTNTTIDKHDAGTRYTCQTQRTYTATKIHTNKLNTQIITQQRNAPKLNTTWQRSQHSTTHET